LQSPFSIYILYSKLKSFLPSSIDITRQVGGSIPKGLIGDFQYHNPSGSTIALESIQLLTEMITRCISWVKGGR
jgi:hypothetical protein